MSNFDKVDTSNDFVNTLIRVGGKHELRDTADNARLVLTFLELTKNITEHNDYHMIRDARDLIQRMAIDAIDYVQFQLSEKQL